MTACATSLGKRAVVLLDARHGRGPRRAAGGARREEADDRRGLLRDVRRRAVRARPPEACEGARPRLGAAACRPEGDDPVLPGRAARDRPRACARRAGRCGFDPAARHRVARPPRRGRREALRPDRRVRVRRPGLRRRAVRDPRARKGDRNPLLGLETNVHQASGAPTEFFSAGLHAATLCSDLRFPWGTATTNRQAFITGRLVTLPAQATWPFTPATAAGNGIIATCKNWPETPAPRRSRRGSRPSRCSSSAATGTSRRRTSGRGRRPRSRRRGSS